MQHRHYGSGSDTGAHENYWRIAGPQRESSARRTHFENIAGMYLSVQK
jgi:hypothetical protein